MKGKTMKLFNVSLLGLAFLTWVNIVAQGPNCATSLNSTFVVGIDTTPPAPAGTGPGYPWITLNSAGLPVGFDISVICALAQVLGYSDIQFVCTLDANADTAIATGLINAAICVFPTIPNPTGAIATVKYQQGGTSTDLAPYDFGIRISSTCCQLFANLTAAVAFLESNGTLGALRTEFGITPNVPPVADPTLVPAGCTGFAPALPDRNAIGLYILNKYCLSICDNSNYVPC